MLPKDFKLKPNMKVKLRDDLTIGNTYGNKVYTPSMKNGEIIIQKIKVISLRASILKLWNQQHLIKVKQILKIIRRMKNERFTSNKNILLVNSNYRFSYSLCCSISSKY